MKTLLLVLLTAVPLRLPAQEIELTDTRPAWSVGVAAFEGRNLSPENIYLTRSFPLLLRERLEAIPEHTFSEAEIRAYRERIIQQERQRLVTAVNADRRARDELFFTSDPVQEKAAAYDERIDANLAAIAELAELDPESIPFPRSKPLRFVSGPEGQLVFDREVLSPLQLAKQQDLDVLLWGEFEEVQGYLYFEIALFHAVLGQAVFTYSDAATSVELYDQADGLIMELATVLWGRDWSSLTVRTEPPGASVWIDTEFQGRTPLDIPYLRPGARELRVEASGYEPVHMEVELVPYLHETQDITLLPQVQETFRLESEPAGAAVFRGSQWLGTTPLRIEKPEEINRLLLRREGYLDFPLYAQPGVGDSVTVRLVPDSIDPAEIQTRRRNEMYGAFGIFALSIPFPLFLSGYMGDYRAAGRDTQLLTYAYIGTFALSASLFVNLALRLVRYLRAADRKA
jgi:hypothetical protein